MFDDKKFGLDINFKQIINYGLLLNDKIIYASRSSYEAILQMVNYCNSFASNIKNGRLFKIVHEVGGETWVTLVHNRLLSDGKNLMYVLSGNIKILSDQFSQQILENYYKELESNINVRRIEKLIKNDDVKLEILMHKITDKVEMGISLILDIEESANNFLVDDRKEEDTIIYYVGISSMGLPVSNRLYNLNLISQFNLQEKKDLSNKEVLQTLLSAHFSAIVNSSLMNANTLVKEIEIKFTTLDKMKEDELKIVFFPIGYNGQYTLEIMYQGDGMPIEGFKKACETMFGAFLQVPFKGNLREYSALNEMLAGLPDTFDLFGYDLKRQIEIIKYEQEQKQINANLLLDFSSEYSQFDHAQVNQVPPKTGSIPEEENPPVVENGAGADNGKPEMIETNHDAEIPLVENEKDEELDSSLEKLDVEGAPASDVVDQPEIDHSTSEDKDSSSAGATPSATELFSLSSEEESKIKEKSDERDANDAPENDDVIPDEKKTN
ncbi:MAG: hypothetical protein ACTSVI_11305 [Promethearchaeota archaeon]